MLLAYDHWANERPFDAVALLDVPLWPRLDVLYERSIRQRHAAWHVSFEMAT